jgi:large subunit ribosomal protein L35
MFKLKTHSGAKKRFKKHKSGVIKAQGAFHRHLMTKKTAKRKRNSRKSFCLNAHDYAHILPLLPY